jgi:hypothetical protein
VIALAVTNRDPDPMFMNQGWSPIASDPSGALLIGSLGLDVLVATAVTAAVVRLRGSRSGRRAPVVLTGALALAGALVWVAATAPTADLSTDTMHALLRSPRHETSRATPQAQRAMQLAMGLPGTPTSGVRITDGGRTPVGPWVLQRVEVVDTNLSDEHAEVTVETLVDPGSGAIRAAWFSGL